MKAPQIELMDIVGLYEVLSGLNEHMDANESRFEEAYAATIERLAKRRGDKLVVNTKVFLDIIKQTRELAERAVEVDWPIIYARIDSMILHCSEMNQEADNFASYFFVELPDGEAPFEIREERIGSGVHKIFGMVEDFNETLTKFQNYLDQYRREGVKYPATLDIDLGMLNDCLDAVCEHKDSERTGKDFLNLAKASLKLNKHIDGLKEKLQGIQAEGLCLGLSPNNKKEEPFLMDFLEKEGYIGRSYMGEFRYKYKYKKPISSGSHPAD